MSNEYILTIWQGDSQQIVATLSEGETEVDLSTATSITAVMEEFSGSPSYTIACTGDEDGKVTIQLTGTQTVSPGSYKLRVVVKFGNDQYTWGPAYIKILANF
jgi:hypothetical protein